MLGVVLEEPSNETTVRNYEVLAKSQIDQYLSILQQKATSQNDPEKMADILGQRNSLKRQMKMERREITEYLALEFFQRLYESFHNFQDFCSSPRNIDTDDCKILLRNDTNNFLFVDTLKHYNFLLT